MSAVTDIAKELDATPEEVKIDPHVVTLSNGIVLRTRPVPYKLIINLKKRFKNPLPPKVYDEIKEREIVNYADPNWQEECQLVQEELGLAMMDLFTGLGTELVSVPDSLWKPDDKGWEEEISAFLGNEEEIAPSGKARYVAWLSYYALLEANDIQRVTLAVQGIMGVSEEDASAALANFRSNQRRQADPGS